MEYEISLEGEPELTYVLYIGGKEIKRFPKVIPEDYYENMEMEFLKLSIQVSFDRIVKKYC